MKTQRRIGIIISYINTILSTIIGFALSVFLIRKMGAGEYGVYQTMSAFANYLVMLEFGIGTIMTRNIAQCRARGASQLETNKQYVSLFSLALAFAGVILLLSTVFYYCIDDLYENSFSSIQLAYGKRVFLIITLYLLASFLTEVFNGIIQGYERFAFSKSAALVKLIVRTIIVLLVFIWSAHAVTLAIIDFIVSLIYLMSYIVFCKTNFCIKYRWEYFDKQIIISILPYALALILQSVVNQANNNVDQFLIGVFMNPESVAVYSIGLFIFSSYSALAVVPISLFLPKIVIDVEKGIKGQLLTESVIAPSRLITLIGGVILFGFVAVGEKFIAVFYGSEYKQAYIIALIIMIPMFFNMATGILVNVLDAKGKRLTRSLILLVMTIVNIVATIVLIPIWGIVGAAIATAICTLIGQVAIMNYYYYKVIRIDIIKLYRGAFKGLLMSLSVSSLIVFPISKELLPTTIWAVILECVIFITILVVLLLAFGLNALEKEYVKDKFGKLFISHHN